MHDDHNQADARPPHEIARAVERLGIAKANTDGLTLLVLAVLAGAYISLGSLLYGVTVTGSESGFGITRLIGGLAFSLGLVLVILGGAELFTGNNLIAMAWASRLITTRAVIRNWIIVYAGNVLGCLGTVLLVTWANVSGLSKGAVGETLVQIAQSKAELSLLEVFARGILCNALVCIAVWLAMGGRSASDKILSIIFPVTAFVAMGFEHSIANWFFLPMAVALNGLEGISLTGLFRNLLGSTAGNLVGGTLLVAGIYWIAYLRNGDRSN